MGFVSISAAIKTVLSSVTQDGSSAFEDIKEEPTLNFGGFPACSIAPSASPSQVSTNVQNLRSYQWEISLYYIINADNEGLSVAFSAMRTLIDSCLDALDNSNSLDNTALIVRPAPSTWGIVEGETGVMLNANIALEAITSVDTNNG